MSEFNDTKNRQMQLMLEPAQERLKKYSIEELCTKAHIEWQEDKSCFLVNSMGRGILVHYPDFVIEENLEMWHYLTILQYMDTADGCNLAGDYIGLQQMRDGLSRGLGFNKDLDAMFKHDFADVTAEQFKAGALHLGGQVISSKADATVVIPYAPMFPVMLNFYEGDEEFHAAGKALVDKNADHYLSVEAAGGVCGTVVQALKREIEKHRSLS